MTTRDGPDLCYALAARKAARYLSRLYDSHLTASGLSVSQFSILSLMEAHGSLTLSSLAEMLVMERTSLVRALRPLQQAGWILAERAEGRRSFELTLTATGLLKVTEAASLWDAAQMAFEDGVGRDRAERMRSEIGRVLPGPSR